MDLIYLAKNELRVENINNLLSFSDFKDAEKMPTIEEQEENLLKTKIDLINQNKLNKKNKLHNNIEQHNNNLISQINIFNNSINLIIKKINQNILSQIKEIILSVQQNKNQTGGEVTTNKITDQEQEQEQEQLDYNDFIKSFTDLEEFIIDLGIEYDDFQRIINLLDSHIDRQSFLLNNNSKTITDTEVLNKTEHSND